MHEATQPIQVQPGKGLTLSPRSKPSTVSAASEFLKLLRHCWFGLGRSVLPGQASPQGGFSFPRQVQIVVCPPPLHLQAQPSSGYNYHLYRWHLFTGIFKSLRHSQERQVNRQPSNVVNPVPGLRAWRGRRIIHSTSEKAKEGRKPAPCGPSSEMLPKVLSL